jgi:small subunit ribosomal protein S17
MTDKIVLPKKKKVFTGKVISNKMDKTAVVQIERTVVHAVYQKVVKRFTRLKAHDQNNQCQVGDKVKIIETRPFSKEKHWSVVEIISSVPKKFAASESGE